MMENQDQTDVIVVVDEQEKQDDVEDKTTAIMQTMRLNFTAELLCCQNKHLVTVHTSYRTQNNMLDQTTLETVQHPEDTFEDEMFWLRL